MAKQGEGMVRIGTSGWKYKHWVGPFYPSGMRAGAHLDFYTRHFDTVEINNSFYRLPEEATFDRWREAVPAGFVFAVKGSRYTTHMKKLKEPRQSTRNFIDRVRLLGPFLGPILYQLPPRWKRNPERLDTFLAALPQDLRFAIELRDRSWRDEEIYDILRRHNVAFCIYELAGVRSDDVVTANDLVYIRLHGPRKAAYTGSYSDRRLDDLAARIRAWAKDGRDVFCYFDNDQAGYAVQDAQRLKQRLGLAELSRRRA